MEKVSHYEAFAAEYRKFGGGSTDGCVRVHPAVRII